MQSAEERNCDYLAETALFVANKWDLVEEEERREVESHIVAELEKYWPEGDPHIIYVSIKDAIHQKKDGNVTKAYDTLLEGIHSMVLRVINSRLKSHWT